MPEFESTESRLARGDWRSRIVSWQYTARKKGSGSKHNFFHEGFATEEQAIADFKRRVDERKLPHAQH